MSAPKWSLHVGVFTITQALRSHIYESLRQASVVVEDLTDDKGIFA